MPKWRRPSHSAASPRETASASRPNISAFSSNENSPLDPQKSRFHSACCGCDSSAGCSTDATSGRAASQRATCSADFSCARILTSAVRKPRSTSQASSPPTQRPSCRTAVHSLGHSSSRTTTAPISRSECPPQYLVSGRIDASTPQSKGRENTGEAQALSIIVITPRARATAQMAGTSCTSKV